MLQRVSMNGIELPRLYIAENDYDVSVAKENGLPYIKWRHGKEALIKQLLRPTLEKMFPGIIWNKVLGKKKRFHSDVVICEGFTNNEDHAIADYNAEEMLKAQLDYDNHVDELDHDWAEQDSDGTYSRVVDIADSQRDICSDMSFLGYNAFIEDRMKIEDYVGDLSSSVDINALQKLGLLPKFVGDVADCIRLNLSNNIRWTEGYNKKLGVPLGNFKSSKVLPNLIIIDVSSSIPDGIAATMLTLADTLRSQCNAELIITSARSGYYPVGSELPKPQTLRDYYGRSNEGAEFMAIINKYISGREFGHVISFGDSDDPGNAYYWRCCGGKDDYRLNLANTKVHAVHHYHTNRKNTSTGYAAWADDCMPENVFYDTSWCNVMNRSYSM